MHCNHTASLINLYSKVQNSPRVLCQCKFILFLRQAHNFRNQQIHTNPEKVPGHCTDCTSNKPPLGFPMSLAELPEVWRQQERRSTGGSEGWSGVEVGRANLKLQCWRLQVFPIMMPGSWWKFSSPFISTATHWPPGVSHRLCLSLHLTLSRDLQRERRLRLRRHCGPCGCDERPSKRGAWAGTLCSDTETSQAPAFSPPRVPFKNDQKPWEFFGCRDDLGWWWWF